MLAPEVEARPWAEQLAIDDACYRRQLVYLFDRSAFYREKLAEAGLASARAAGGLADIARLPLTEKREIKASCTPDNPIGAHLCGTPSEIVRIYSTSGTTGTPSYVPLTASDLDNWVTASARSYAASGITAGQRIVSTYNAGPFVAGAALAAFDRIGLCHIPVGTGNTERLMLAVELLRPEAAVLTPSYAAYLIEWAAERNFDLGGSSVKRVLVAGEPAGGEPAFRAKLEEGWGARVTEAMGIGDIGVSLWGECEEQDGMHLGARGFVHAELIDPETGTAVELDDGVTGELVLTHLQHRAAPLLRFRTRDHVQVRMSHCRCGRTSPRVRCIGRTDDMLIVRGVNVFPSAVREVVSGFIPRVSGHILVKPLAPGVKQEPPLPVSVELAQDATADAALAEAIRDKLRNVLVVQTRIDLVPWGSLRRSEYKSKLVEQPRDREDHMAAITLNILKPSVNNLTVRIFVRAAKLDFEEVDVWGKTLEPEFLQKDPAHLTPMIEEEGLPRGTLWESCAIMQYLCNKHGLDQFYPKAAAERAMIDSAMFYLIGTLYPLVARATYPVLGFPQYPGEVATSDADDDMKARAQQDAEAALAEPLDVYRAFFLDGKAFIGGAAPSIADIRLAATLEFLQAIDYELPAWAQEYMAAMETSLGEAYAEPAADVRGYVASVK